MPDRQTRDELEGLHALGDLADDMVSTLGRVVRSEPLAPADHAALRKARSLFEVMTSRDVLVVGDKVGRMLGAETGYLDALRAVERQADGDDVDDYASRYVDLLTTVIDNHGIPEAEGAELKPQFVALRNLFEHMGEATLARDNELISRRPESPWRSMLPTSLRF